MFYGAHCSNARAQWQLPRCPIIIWIDLELYLLSCLARCRVAAQLTCWECGRNRGNAVSRVCLQGAGLSWLSYLGKDEIKRQCRRTTKHLSPPLAALCLSSTTGVRSGIGRETALARWRQKTTLRACEELEWLCATPRAQVDTCFSWRGLLPMRWHFIFYFICVAGAQMADSAEFARLMEANAALLVSLVQALQGVRPAPAPTPLQRFLGHPESPGDPTVDEWLSDFDVFVRQCGVPEGERAVVLVDYLGGCAKEEVLCHPVEVRRDVGALVSLLRRVFGPWETVTLLQAEFYARMQSVGETLAEYSRALIRLHQRIEGAAPTVTERQALAVLGDGALKHQFVVGVRKEWVRRELRRLMWRLADKPCIVRGEALCLMCEEEDRVVQMRPVEKVTPALSVPVGRSVADVLGLDDVVSGVGDPVGCCVDKVLSGAVSGGLCDLDRVSGGGGGRRWGSVWPWQGVRRWWHGVLCWHGVVGCCQWGSVWPWRGVMRCHSCEWWWRVSVWRWARRGCCSVWCWRVCVWCQLGDDSWWARHVWLWQRGVWWGWCVEWCWGGCVRWWRCCVWWWPTGVWRGSCWWPFVGGCWRGVWCWSGTRWPRRRGVIGGVGVRGGSTWRGGRARLCRWFPAARATADAHYVLQLLYFIGSCLLARDMAIASASMYDCVIFICVV